MTMTREEFKEVMGRCVSYYGRERFEPVHIEAIYPSFERFTKERFEKVMKIVFATCSYPPRLAEFLKAAEELKLRERNAPMYEVTKAIPDLRESFFPSDEWLEESVAKECEGKPPEKRAQLLHFMKTLRGALKANRDEYQRMMKASRRTG